MLDMSASRSKCTLSISRTPVQGCVLPHRWRPNSRHVVNVILSIVFHGVVERRFTQRVCRINIHPCPQKRVRLLPLFFPIASNAAVFLHPNSKWWESPLLAREAVWLKDSHTSWPSSVSYDQLRYLRKYQPSVPREVSPCFIGIIEGRLSGMGIARHVDAMLAQEPINCNISFPHAAVERGRAGDLPSCGSC
jgi:hypothetical protein